MNFASFHDALLLTVRSSWESAETRIRIRLSSDPVRHVELVVTRTTMLKGSQLSPWGASLSINRVAVTKAEPGHLRLEIEMQSGDQWEIDGSEILQVEVDGKHEVRDQ